MAVSVLPNALIAGALVLTVAVAYRAWRNRPTRGATLLAAFMGAIALIQVNHLATHVFDDQLGVVLERTAWIGFGTAPFLLLAFVLAYTGRGDWLDRRGYALLFAWPAALNLVLWIPLITGAIGDPVGGTLVAGFLEESNVLFWGNVAVSYGVLAASTAIVAVHVLRTGTLFRVQGGTLLVGLTLLWAGSAISLFEVFGSLHVHAIQLGFVGVGLALWIGISYGGITDVVPVARSTVLDTLVVGVLVLDEDDRLTDVNPYARRLLGLESSRTVVGEPIGTVLDDHPELREAIQQPTETTTQVEVESRDRTRVVKVDVSPLDGPTGDRVGAAVLLYDISDQRERQRELERQNAQLNQFASLVSHDLRNPLATSNAHAELAKDVADNPETVAQLEKVKSANDRMGDLIDDVLTLAQGGESVTHASPVSLETAATEAWSHVDTAGGTMVVEADLHLKADHDRFLRLFENLFRNAIEHGGDDVTVRVGTIPDGVSADDTRGFFVEDDGPGIPADRREKVFEDGFSTSEEGTGLGLSIVETIVDAHGWEIDLAESESSGARFEITGVEQYDPPPAVPAE